MTPKFVLITSMGSAGQKWLEEMLAQFSGLHVTRWFPALPPDYKKTIELNPMLRKVDLQNHSLRTLMPLDCLFEEVLRCCPPSPLHVVSHFHSATSLWNNYQKYPNREIAHKVAYLYGCPIKRLRSAIKNQLHYTTQNVIDNEGLLSALEHMPQLRQLIADTEKHCAITLTEMQRISIARLIHYSVSVCEDIQRAELLGAHMLNFEVLKKEPVVLQAFLAWASDGELLPDEQTVAGLYRGTDDLAKYHYDGYAHTDSNQQSLIEAPYDGEAIWHAMNDWQRYMYRQMTKLLPFDYIDFYYDLGIDLSYMKAA